MPKTTLGGFTQGTDTNGSLVRGCWIPAGTVDSDANFEIQDYAGRTYEDLYLNCSSHSGGFNEGVTFRFGGAASTNLTLTVAGSGEHVDTTGTDTSIANDQIGAISANATSMHGDTAVVENYRLSASAGGGYVGGQPSAAETATEYCGLWAETRSATAAEALTRLYRTTVFNNLFADILAGPSGTTTYSLYEATAGASSNVTISVTASGDNTDTTGTESYDSGTDVGFQYVGSSGNTSTAGGFAADADIDEIPRGSSGSLQLTSTDKFIPINGRLAGASTTDASGVTKHDIYIGAEIVSNLGVYVSAVSTPSSARIAFRIGTTISSNVTVAPSSTGLITDETGSETLADADEVSFLGDTASGTFDVTSIYVEMPSVVSAVAPSMDSWFREFQMPVPLKIEVDIR